MTSLAFKSWFILIGVLLSTNVHSFMRICRLNSNGLRRASFQHKSSLSSEEIKLRLEETMAKLREKDKRSKVISAQELTVVYEDQYIIIIEKPSGVLSIPSEPGVPSLIEAVFEYCKESLIDESITSKNQMVVHRLGLDTSGLMIFGKTKESVRNMNELFRNRNITRQYEVLVAGHVEKDQGLINFPLMRCYEYPPYMRIATKEHQRNLLDLDPSIVGKKMLEAPKSSLTHFKVMKREYFKGRDDLPVTRMTLTSMTGRTHQLNVHCAAIGHPIVLDTVYGSKGTAAQNGGLSADSLPLDRATIELQQALSDAANATDNMCAHAKLIRFRHPFLDQQVEFSSPAPF